MGKYQSYPDYSKTNNRWLDKIPSHWRITQIKHIVSTRVTDGPHSTPEFLDVGVPFVSAEAVSGGFINFNKIRGYISEKDDEAFSQKYRPQKHDVYMVKSGATTGVTAIVETDQRFNIWSPLAVMRCASTYNPYFLLNSLRSDYFQKSVQLSWTFGTQQNIGMGTLENLSVCYPPLEEQVQIANFLDHETAKIDTLIEKQQQLIKLLKEKRQAVISHAVTKGLNPQAPMKNSGVEWLGEVPEHWKVVPLKYLCRFSGGGTPSKDNLSYWTNGTTPWVSPKDMKTFWIEKTQDYVTDIAVKESSTNLVEKGALLMVVRSGILQRTIPIAINTVPVTLNQDMKALRFNNRMLATFASDYILGNVDKLLLEWSKEGATVESIEHEYLANGLFPVPPIVEQRQIVEALTQQKERFDELEGKAIVGIKLLQERRTALISAAVTGKIDVRNWQAPTSQNQELEQTA
ncbi:TPA: restriction endonuclease subunit S [Vibrio parahaemolyticus]|nr:restriction endonuclease subunit S [Vibrio parahaemolyticus]HCE1798256.1 restriction endonuclease subunit S [Vibrio parahaemolyticus]HCH2082976.1 restriction endonuclease subunit S [Vibrio parahaemolyticus]